MYFNTNTYSFHLVKPRHEIYKTAGLSLICHQLKQIRSYSYQLSSFMIYNYSGTAIVSNLTKSSNTRDTILVSNTCIELSNALHVLCISRTNYCSYALNTTLSLKSS